MYRVEIKKKEQKIESVEQWKKISPPKKENEHWKDGRSAKELAKYMIKENGGLPKEIEEILLNIGCSKIGEFIGEPEKVTSLIGKGMGRNHDLLLIKEQEIVIGIEGKSDEILGKYISDELANKNISENKINRINELYKLIYGCYPSKGENIRYQLLTATVGTLVEAKKLNISKALLLIITFKKDGSYDNDKINLNKKDIDVFIESLHKYSNKDRYNLHGYKDIDFYIRYIEINI